MTITLEVIPIAIGVFAGVATFFSPCMLPLIPAFLAHLAGVNIREINRKSTRIRLNVFTHSLLFVVGFSVVFVILGSSLLLATQFLQGFQVWIARIGGAIIIAFGIYTLGLVPGITILDRARRIESPFKRPTGYATSAIIGATFGIGWTPCVGPILGSIFVLAGTAATLTQGV
ncbi:MAG: cytochrome c biogenesis protein CcdA, partial [Nitrosopumilus sp.]